MRGYSSVSAYTFCQPYELLTLHRLLRLHITHKHISPRLKRRRTVIYTHIIMRSIRKIIQQRIVAVIAYDHSRSPVGKPCNDRPAHRHLVEHLRKRTAAQIHDDSLVSDRLLQLIRNNRAGENALRNVLVVKLVLDILVTALIHVLSLTVDQSASRIAFPGSVTIS